MNPPETIAEAKSAAKQFSSQAMGHMRSLSTALAVLRVGPLLILAAMVVVGFDGAPEEFAAIEAGTETATVVQYPAKIGEYGVETLFKALNGEKVPAFVDTGTGLAMKDNLAKFK